jgi:addiction module HigA family antidote
MITPGSLINEELKARKWTQSHLAEIIDEPISVVRDLINGQRSISAQIANKLSTAFGTSTQLWMGLESDYKSSKSKS